MRFFFPLRARSDDGLNRIRLFFLLYQAGLGIYYTFFVVYLEQERGLGGLEIGALLAISPLMTLLVTPLWGRVADARGSRQTMLRWALMGAALGALFVAFPRDFWPLLVAVAFFMLFQVAVVPLSDGLVATAAHQRRVPYGKLRWWGSIGLAFGSMFFGLVLNVSGLGSLFYFFAGLMFLAMLAAWRMVSDEPPAVASAGSGHIRELLRDGPLARFLLVAGLGAVGMAMTYSYVYLHLAQLGASGGLIGAISALGALAEALSMHQGDRLMQRWGAPRVYAIGLSFFAASCVLFAVISNPWWGLLAMFINGIGMGLQWPAGVTYVAWRAPAAHAAGAQSLKVTVTFGISSLIASQLGGVVYDVAGSQKLMAVSGGILIAAVVLFFVLGRAGNQEPPERSAASLSD